MVQGENDVGIWPIIAGGTIEINFGYGSEFDILGHKEADRYNTIHAHICDNCFKRKRHLTQNIKIERIVSWQVVN